MGNLFGKSKAKAVRDSHVTSQDRAILQIKQQRDKVKQYQKKLSNQLEHETEIIKTLVKQQQKQKALLLMKKKKFTEKILERTENELMNIENLIMDIEYKNVEQSVLKGMQIGNEAMKTLNAVFSIDQIEALLEETEEGIRKQQEISDLLSGWKEEEESEALDKELEDLLAADISPLPEVPKEELPSVQRMEKKKEKESKQVLVEAQ